MDVRNRLGLYGAYFFGMAGIGFTLPFLPLYLGHEGLSDRTIGLISTFAALAGLAQFPIGLISDRLGTRKPFLVASLSLLALATFLLNGAHGTIWLGILVVLFAENGICRAIVESLAGAEAAALARPEGVGAALGALRFWKPVGIILVALLAGTLAESRGVGAILIPLAIVQGLAVGAALLIHEPQKPEAKSRNGKSTESERVDVPRGVLPRDPVLWIFIGAMILFHAANAPGGIYLGLYLKRDLDAPERMLAYAFVVSMITWMLVVWPAGWLADRWGRRPLLILCWGAMAVRLAIVAITRTPFEVVVNQVLDGLSNGLFAVLAAAWVTDRLADSRRVGEAQVIVGTSLVLGSALGPALSSLIVEATGYRMLFALLAAMGAVATGVIVAFVPESLTAHPPEPARGKGDSFGIGSGQDLDRSHWIQNSAAPTSALSEEHGP